VTTRKTVHDYEIYDKLWTKIEPLLPLPKPKRSLEDLEKMIRAHSEIT
jgi:transposase